MLRKPLLFVTIASVAALATVAACLPATILVEPDSGPTTDASPDGFLEGSADATHDALPDTYTASLDAGDSGDAADAKVVEAGPFINILVSGSSSAPGETDGAAPWQSNPVTVTRGLPTSKLVLSSTADGTGDLGVDDNIHLVVVKPGGATVDQFYKFWFTYPCPDASKTNVPGGNGSGGAPALDVTQFFAADNATSQKFTLEFWHCAQGHGGSHGDFWLVEK